MDTNGQTVTVALTETGIGKVAAGIPVDARTNFENNEAFDNAIDGNFIQVRFNAKINGNAYMDSLISNTAKLKYNNGSFAMDKEIDSTDEIEITTGGRLSRESTLPRILAGAGFLLLEDGQEKVWSEDLITANKATGDNKYNFVNPVSGAPIKLVSN